MLIKGLPNQLISLFATMSNRKFTVCVEGNIGCGKSSFIRHFANKLPYLAVVEEPVAQWTNLENNNLLGMMYSDPKRWSTVFQAYVMLTMSDGHSISRESSSPRVSLLERSLHSAVHVFVENMHRQNLMEKMDYLILREWYNMWVKSDRTYDIDVIIYLRAKPSVCLQRVKQRNRSEECDLSIEHLEQLHELHEDWLIQHKFGCPSTRVVVIDAERDLAELASEYDTQVLPILQDFGGCVGALSSVSNLTLSSASAAE